MYISPYFCSNVAEFVDEHNVLRERTFPYIKDKLYQSEVTFAPIQLQYAETDHYFKSGHLLRLLLNNIHLSQPFFVGLIGFRYGSSKSSSTQNVHDSSLPGQYLSPVEKNLLIASQTGFSHVVNAATFSNSFLEHQINFACSSGQDTSWFRFYFRQYEFLEAKYADLPVLERKEAIKSMEAEDEWAKRKLDELKMRLIKKGVTIRYYKSIDEFNRLILADLEDILKGLYLFLI